MKLYLILCISGIDVLCHTVVGESYEDVFDKEIKSLRETYGNAIDNITVKEITASNGYEIVLRKIDAPDLPFVTGREDI